MNEEENYVQKIYVHDFECVITISAGRMCRRRNAIGE